MKVELTDLIRLTIEKSLNYRGSELEGYIHRSTSAESNAVKSMKSELHSINAALEAIGSEYRHHVD
jgi:hypothetical protein